MRRNEARYEDASGRGQTATRTPARRRRAPGVSAAGDSEEPQRNKAQQDARGELRRSWLNKALPRLAL